VTSSAAASCCCCCSSRVVSSRYRVDYAHLAELQRRQSALSDGRQASRSSVEPPPSPSPEQHSLRRSRVDVQPSPTLDDEEEPVMDVYDRGTRATSRPTAVLRLTTFKPTIQQPLRQTTSECGFRSTGGAQDDDDDARTAGNTANKQLPSTTTSVTSTVSSSSSVAVVSSTAASASALDRLQPDLLPLVSSAAAVAEDCAVVDAVIHRQDDLP